MTILVAPPRVLRLSFSRSLCVLAVLLPVVTSHAQPGVPPLPTPAALKALSLEELSQIEVTSAGRKVEPLSRVAAAVYVITQEEIHRTGVRNIPEALRLATGLEVAMFNNGSWPISARGFNTTSANKLQVFMDGRSLYSPLFGGVFWDMQNAVIEDIDRIEVIRGPGATLWGGNAVNAVINIITKSAKDTLGGLFVAGGGVAERGFVTLRYGGAVGEHTAYRVYGNFFNRDSLRLLTGADAKDPNQIGQGGFRVDTSITPADQLTVQGDVYSGEAGILNRADIAIHGGNLLTRWKHQLRNGSDLQVQSYYDRTTRRVPNQVDEARNTYDVDAQHHFHAGERHDVVWGMGYRASNNMAKPQTVLFFEPSGRHLALFNIFGQDEIALSETVHLTLGAKFENQTFAGWNVQPSARLSWTPNTHHSYWGAISRAVRLPTQFDRDLRIRALNSAIVLIRGDAGFQPERLTAYELGYRVIPLPQISLDIATYYNRYDRLRSQELSTGGGLPLLLANRLFGKTFGAEITARYQIQPWWRLTSGYSNLQKRLSVEPGSTDRSGGRQEGFDPRNQFSLRSTMDLPHKTALDFWVRHVGALSLASGPPVPAYTVFDVRFGWKPVDQFEISLVGRHLPKQGHLEFGPAGELVRRAVYVTTTWRF